MANSRALELLAGLLVLLLTACSTVDQAGKNQRLHLQLQSYDHAVRWGDPAEAYAFLQPDEVPVAIPAGLDEIRVTGYEELTPPLRLEEDKVSRKVKIEYVHRDRQVVRTLIDDQVWAYDPQNEQWFRINPLPEYK